jgi:hypothetical protein
MASLKETTNAITDRLEDLVQRLDQLKSASSNGNSSQEKTSKAS